MKNLFKRIKESYELKRFKSTVNKHPEIENYGLECDVNLWVEFNKENQIRDMLHIERSKKGWLNTERLLLDNDVIIEEHCGTEEERNRAEVSLALKIASGEVSSLTYLDTTY